MVYFRIFTWFINFNCYLVYFSWFIDFNYHVGVFFRDFHIFIDFNCSFSTFSWFSLTLAYFSSKSQILCFFKFNILKSENKISNSQQQKNNIFVQSILLHMFLSTAKKQCFFFFVETLRYNYSEHSFTSKTKICGTFFCNWWYYKWAPHASNFKCLVLLNQISMIIHLFHIQLQETKYRNTENWNPCY